MKRKSIERRPTRFADHFGQIIKVGDTIEPVYPFVGKPGRVVVRHGAYRVDTGVGNLDFDCSLLCGPKLKPIDYKVIG